MTATFSAPREDGVVAMWDTKTGGFAAEVAKKFALKGVTRLGSNGEGLCAADDSTVYRCQIGATSDIGCQ